MALNFTRIFSGLNIKPKVTSTVSAAGDLDFSTSSNKLNLHNGTISSPVVTEAGTATLTNKSIDADTNTITNIENADIKTGAAIARNKLASGNNYRVVTNDGTGVMVDAAAITPARALISDANGIPTHSVVTAAELATLSGSTGSVLTQTNTVANIVNKTFEDSTTLFQDNADNTKQFKFEASGISTASTRTITIPDANITLVGTNNTQTLSNKTLDNTTSLTIQDSNLVLQDNLDNTKQLQFQISGIGTGTTRTLSVPDASTTILGTDAVQIITNKDIDGGTATNARRITMPKNTKVNLDSLTRKEATVVYGTDTQTLYVDNGTILVPIGSGGGSSMETFNFDNNEASPVDVTGFLVDSLSNQFFKSDYSIMRESVNDAITIDTAFNTALGTGFDDVVYSSETQSSGKLVVGGAFTTFNGNSRVSLVRLNEDGTEDTAFYSNLGTSFNNFCQYMTVQSDDKILVGGLFTSFNGNTRNRLVRLNSDGTEDTGFYGNLGTAFNNNVHIVILEVTGKITVGGSFSTLNGNARTKAVRLNSDGTEDTAFNTALGTGFNGSSNQVLNIFQSAEFDLYFSGTFTSLNGGSAVKLARVSEASTEVMEIGIFNGIYRPSLGTWEIVNETFSGDSAGVVFSMDNSGQLQYTSTDIVGSITNRLNYYLYLL